MKFWILTLAVAGAAAAYIGCDDHEHTDDHAHTDGGHTTAFPACTEITEGCHEVDTGEATPIHDCHDKAHAAKSEADCTSIKANCLAICAAAKADAGVTGDGGEEHDGGH